MSDEGHDIPLLGPTPPLDVDAAAAQKSLIDDMGGVQLAVSLVGTVESVRYASLDRTDVICISLEGGEEVTVANGGFTLQNPGLCVLAYMGAKPSDLDAAEGVQIPLVIDQFMNPRVPDHVIDEGRERLAESAWGPDGGVKERMINVIR